MRKCKNCGFENPDNINFCGNCGFQLQKVPLGKQKEPSVDKATLTETGTCYTAPKKFSITNYIIGFRENKKNNKIIAIVFYILFAVLSLNAFRYNRNIHTIFSAIALFLRAVALVYVIFGLYDAIRNKSFLNLIKFPLIGVMLFVCSIASSSLTSWLRVNAVGFPFNADVVMDSINRSIDDNELIVDMPNLPIMGDDYDIKETSTDYNDFEINTYNLDDEASTNIICSDRYDKVFVFNVRCLDSYADISDSWYLLYNLYGFAKCVDNSYTPERFKKEFTDLLNQAYQAKDHSANKNINNIIYDIYASDNKTIINAYRKGYNLQSLTQIADATKIEFHADDSILTPVELAQKNMAPHLEVLGKESEDGDITVSSEAFKTQNDVNLFGLSGSTSCGLTSKSATQIRWADWESNTNLSEEEFKNFLLHMNDYFGMEYEIKSYDKIPADEVYEWRGYSDTQYAICYYNSSKAYIKWYYTGEVTTPAAAPTTKPTATPTKAPTPEPPKEKEFIRENYGYVNYKELARNPDDYKGKSVTYSGKVIQVIEGDSETQLRIAVDGDYDKVIYVSYPKDMVQSRILDDDYVTIFGTSLGVITYKSTMGASITIPGVYLDRIELQ